MADADATMSPTKTSPSKGSPTKRSPWKVPNPPYRISLKADLKDPAVEDIKTTVVKPPKAVIHGHGGRPLSEPMLAPHSPQTNNGYARNSLGGYFTT